MYTRCPHCDTVFRVTPQQLQASSGQVRCGRCAAVFDAFSSLSSLPPSRESGVPGVSAAQEKPAVAPEIPAADGAGRTTQEAKPPPARAAAPAPPARPAKPAPAAQEPLTLPEELFQPGLTSPGRRWSWRAINLALVLGLAAQGAWFYPTQLGLQAPALAPALEVYCAWLGCSFGLPRIPEQLFIEASDLQLLDQARPSQVLLTATVRNRAAFAQAFPLLELTLTGVDNQTAARRVFPPAEYLNPAVDSARGIGAQQEVSIRLYLDTADLRATGYRLYLFFA